MPATPNQSKLEKLDNGSIRITLKEGVKFILLTAEHENEDFVNAEVINTPEQGEMSMKEAAFSLASIARQLVARYGFPLDDILDRAKDISMSSKAIKASTEMRKF